MSLPRFWQLRLITGLLVAVGLCGPVSAQGQLAATLTFTQDFPGSDPSHYAISIASDGRASYEGNGRLFPGSSTGSEDDVPDSERVEFTASPSLITKTFELAKRAQYFQGELDSKKRNLAFTGAKTLTYKDAERNTRATYNYSVLPVVQELTRILQNLSSTLEYGRRLKYYHRHQKLALDEETKRMEAAAKDGSLEEVSAIAPILQKIVDDHSVINLARARLQRLLDQANAK